MSKTIVPIEHHYTGRVTWRGQLALKNIKSKFEALQLLERTRACPFKQFFEAPPLKFSRVIIYQLFLRKIKSAKLNEIHAEVGGKPVNFGLGEYHLIIGLNCVPYPNKKVSTNTRLVFEYLNNSSNVRSHELKAAFAGCLDQEDAWKLGMVHFVNGPLYLHDSNAKVDMYLSLIECKEDFFKYPFGTESFKRTLIGLDKDIVHLRGLYLKSLQKRNEKKEEGPKYTAEAKYTVYGYAIAFQY